MQSKNPYGAENSQDGLEYWISGFVDGEGCFSVSIYRNKTMRLGWQVFPEFTISQNIRNRKLLEEIRAYFKCGSVIANKRHDNHHYDMCKFTVRDLLSLTKVIIPFFESYPLRTHKKKDFEIFVRIVRMIEKKDHLTIVGLISISKEIKQMNTKGSRKFESYLQRLDTNPSNSDQEYEKNEK